MLNDALHQPLAETTPAMRFQHENVAEIPDGGVIADDSRKSCLSAATIINAKAQRVLDRTRHNFARDACGPVAVGKETVNDGQIQTFAVSANQKIASAMFCD